MNYKLLLQKALLSLLFVHLFISSHAQEEKYQFNKKVVYEITYLRDSTDLKSEHKEMAELLLNDSISLFRTLSKAEQDVDFYTPSMFPTPTVVGFAEINSFNYQIVKYGNGYVKTYDEYTGSDLKNLDQLNYYVEQFDSENWIIQEDTLTIHGINCQLASLNFAGRIWNAWFSTSIPIFDGPYKFCNLPGLIISISDASKSWNFNLVELKDVHQTESINRKKGLKITQIEKQKLFNQRKKYQIDLINRELSSQNMDNKLRIELENKAKANNNMIEL